MQDKLGTNTARVLKQLLRMSEEDECDIKINGTDSWVPLDYKKLSKLADFSESLCARIVTTLHNYDYINRVKHKNKLYYKILPKTYKLEREGLL